MITELLSRYAKKEINNSPKTCKLTVLALSALSLTLLLSCAPTPDPLTETFTAISDSGLARTIHFPLGKSVPEDFIDVVTIPRDFVPGEITQVPAVDELELQPETHLILIPTSNVEDRATKHLSIITCLKVAAEGPKNCWSWLIPDLEENGSKTGPNFIGIRWAYFEPMAPTLNTTHNLAMPISSPAN